MIGKILLLPLKLLAKLLLYILYVLVLVIAMVIFIFSGIIGRVLRGIAILGGIAFTAMLVISHTVEGMEPMTDVVSIVVIYAFIVFEYALPSIAEAISGKLLELSENIKELAQDLPLWNKVDYRFYSQQQYQFVDEDDESTQNTYNDYHRQKAYEQAQEQPDQTDNTGFNPFAGVTTIEELKLRYKALARCYHPDVSSGTKEATTKAMQFINSEYERLMAELS
jgi:hypothetical protein